MKKLKKNLLRILFFSIISLFVSFHYYNDLKSYFLLKSNTNKTTGIIIDYYEIGLSSYYLKYSYNVNGHIYTKTVNPDKLYDNCEDDKKCINNKIYVLYSQKDPSISKPILDIKVDK